MSNKAPSLHIMTNFNLKQRGFKNRKSVEAAKVRVNAEKAAEPKNLQIAINLRKLEHAAFGFKNLTSPARPINQRLKITNCLENLLL